MKQYRLFFSWQNDRKDIKNIISASLRKVVDKFTAEGIELIIDQDTRGRVGKRNIATDVLEKICKCDIFVADLTPIVTYKLSESNSLPKHMPNSNVMYEYGYAFHAKGENHMIALAYIDSDKDEHIEYMPFDINHDTITTFTDQGSLSGLYQWIKKIIEHVDMERRAHIPEHDCALLFYSDEVFTDQITIKPHYKKIYYIPTHQREYKESVSSTSPNWLESVYSMQNAIAQLSKPVVPRVTLVHRTINHSYVPLQLVFINKGTEPLDNLRIQIVSNDDRVSFADTNVDETFSLPTLKSIGDISITEKMAVQRVNTINPQDLFLFNYIYVHAPHDVETFTLHWTMSSRNYRSEGVLTIYVTPQYEYSTIENDSLAGTEEVRDNEEAE